MTSLYRIFIVLLLCSSFFFLSSHASGKKSEKRAPKKTTNFIDVHNHLHGGRDKNFSEAADSALKKMDSLGISKMIIMPPPGSPGHRGVVNIKSLRSVIRRHPDRFLLMGGGGSLNVMIQKAKHKGFVSPNFKKKFKTTAMNLIQEGIIGFGELTAEHFSFSTTHPYESVSPGHELFLLLAEIAGKNKMPIDIHMEAISENMPFPSSKFLDRSSHNPANLKENITAFERFVSHNRDAKIIWAHAGWCNTGHRTPELCRRLLSKHSNLYMSFKISPEGKKSIRLLNSDKTAIKPEWLKLINDFPNRFIIGTDQFYGPPGSKQIGPQKTEAMFRFIKLLPSDLSKKMCWDNPKQIFNL